MAADPISLSLATLGTVLSALSFISSTLENVAVRMDDFAECENCLRSYEGQLRYSRIQLRRWQKKWEISDDGPKKTHSKVWGEAGYAEIGGRWKDLLQRIRALHDDIDSLRGASGSFPDEIDISRRDWQSWQFFLSQPEGKDPPTCIRKIIFALWKRRLLSSRFTALRTDIDDLVATSDFWFEDYHLDDGSSSRPMDDALKWRNNITKFSKYMRKVRDRQEGQRTISWSLVLRLPHSESERTCSHCIRCFTKGEAVHVDFIRQLKDGDREQSSEAETMTYNYNGENSNHDPVISPEHSTSTRTLKRQALYSEDSSCPERNFVANNLTRLARARSALGMINWALLLIETEWLMEPSIKYLHYATFDDHWDANSTFFISDTPPLRSTSKKFCDPAWCFLSLGVVLAEIATGEAIESVRIRSLQELYFSSCSWSKISQTDLLRKINSNIKAARYSEAVTSCFALYALLRRIREQKGDLAILNVALIRKALKEVLTPVQEYLKGLENYRSKQPQGWRKKIQRPDHTNPEADRD